MQYIIKDGHGKSVQLRDRFPNYAKVGREMLAFKAVLPLTVWMRADGHAGETYDGQRTRKLSAGVMLCIQRDRTGDRS